MTEAKLTWSICQALLNAFALAFTRRGFHHFAEWITAMAINVEEHTITQSVLALEQPAAWKALESFAENGSWHQDRHLPAQDPPQADDFLPTDCPLPPVDEGGPDLPLRLPPATPAGRLQPTWGLK